MDERTLLDIMLDIEQYGVLHMQSANLMRLSLEAYKRGEIASSRQLERDAIEAGQKESALYKSLRSRLKDTKWTEQPVTN